MKEGGLMNLAIKKALKGTEISFPDLEVPFMAYPSVLRGKITITPL